MTTLHLRISDRMDRDLDILKKQIGMCKSEMCRMAIFNFIKENIEVG